MTRQQELELLAEWLGLKVITPAGDRGLWVAGLEDEWNPSPEGNDTDFLNMVAGRVDFTWGDKYVFARMKNAPQGDGVMEYFREFHNPPISAMKHAAYQVCLMAAREWKGE